MDNSKTVVVFRQWKNKNYAAFSSLGKIIKIGTLSLCYALVQLPKTGHAQNTDTLLISGREEIDEIVVSAEMDEVNLHDAGRLITVISSDEIQRSAIQSLHDLLEYATGVDLRQRGVHGSQADISIRGGSFDQVKILINGINISDPQTGHHHLNLVVDPEDIEKIEIIHGPAGRTLGPDAYTGAINIITKKHLNSHLGVALSGGQFGYYKVNVNAAKIYNNTSNYLSFSKLHSCGYINNTDFIRNNLYYKGNWMKDVFIVNWQGGMSENGFGANSFYTATYPDQFENTSTYFASVDMKSLTRLKIMPAIYWRRNYDRFELFRESKYQKEDSTGLYINGTDTAGFPTSAGIYPYSGHNYHRTDAYGGKLNVSYPWKMGKSSAGFDYRSEIIFSNKLGHPLSDTVFIPREDDGFYLNRYQREQTNAYLEHSVKFWNIYLSGGVLGHWNTDINTVKFFPGVNLTYSLNKSINAYIAYNSSIRMPTFTDMFYVGPTNIGNPDIQPEYAQTTELGLKLKSKAVKLNITGFYRQADNVIDWVKLADSLKWESKNITEINSLGMELYSKIDFISLTNNKDFILQSLLLNYSYVNQTKTSSEYISRYALDYLKHKLSIGINHKIVWKVYGNWRVTVQDREGAYNDAVTGTEVAYKPYVLLDGKIYLQNKWYMIYLEGNNLLNKDYYDYGNVIQPGIWVKGGIKVSFDFSETIP